jgi:hypothetical protein
MDDMAVEMVACADKYILPKLKERAADVIIKHVQAVEDQLRLVNAFSAKVATIQCFPTGVPYALSKGFTMSIFQLSN